MRPLELRRQLAARQGELHGLRDLRETARALSEPSPDPWTAAMKGCECKPASTRELQTATLKA